MLGAALWREHGSMASRELFMNHIVSDTAVLVTVACSVHTTVEVHEVNWTGED